MASYRELDNGRIMAVVRKAGYKPVTKTFDKKREAKAWATELEAELGKGRTVAHLEQTRRTVGELVDRYLHDHLPNLKESSHSTTKVAVAYLKDHLGNVKLSELVPADLTNLAKQAGSEPAMRHNQKNAVGVRSPKTVARYITLWKACLQYGEVQLRWLTHDHNPAHAVKKPNRGEGVVRYLSDEERAQLLRETAKHPALHDAVLVSLWTGARQQEIMGLRAGDIRADHFVLNSTKVSMIRMMPAAPECIAILKRRAEGLEPEDHLWPAKRAASTKPLNLRKPWEAAMRVAGITDFRWHDLRHSAASMLVQAGVPLQHVGQLLGHKQASTTTIYAHLSDKTLQNTMGRLAALASIQGAAA